MRTRTCDSGFSVAVPTRSDEDYLIGLDTTRWLPRVGELLSVACSVCHSLLKNRAHVLVCYESGWDRTTQVRKEGGRGGGVF